MWNLKITRTRKSEYSGAVLDEVFEYEFENVEDAIVLIETTQERGVGEFVYELKKKVKE